MLCLHLPTVAQNGQKQTLALEWVFCVFSNHSGESEVRDGCMKSDILDL